MYPASCPVSLHTSSTKCVRTTEYDETAHKYDTKMFVWGYSLPKTAIAEIGGA